MDKHLFLLVPLALLICACHADEIYTSSDSVELSAASASIGKDGGTVSVTVTSSGDWTASVSVDWLELSQTSGISGEEVSLIASANSSYSRSGTVRFAYGSVSVTFSIYQEGEKGGGTVEGSDTDTSEDNVATTTFDRTIYIAFSKDGTATVQGDGKGYVTVSGNDVTVKDTGSEKIIYELSGTAADGFFKLYSSNKQALKLNDVSITNGGGAAINIQSHKRTFIVVNGTNTISDCSLNSSGSYPDETSAEDMKAAVFSEGQLVFSGTGTLIVIAKGKASITSDDYVRFMSSPTVKVTASAGHGIRGAEKVVVSNGTISVDVSAVGKKGFSSDSLVYIGGGTTSINVTGSAGTVDGEITGTAGIKADKRFDMAGGTLTITNSGKGGKGISGDAAGYFSGGTVSVATTGANYGSSSWGGSSDSSVGSKGIKFDGNLYFTGSNVTVTCSANEGIESKGTIEVSGGEVYSKSSDDAVNSAGDLTVSGGYLCGYSTGNDGIDANGNLYIKGGTVYAVGTSSPEVGIDANSEGGKQVYITGGNIISFGGIESGASCTQAVVTASSWSKDTAYSLYDGSTLLITFTAPSAGGSSVVMSCPSLKSGSSYTFKSGVTLSGGTSHFGGLYTDGATASGGSGSSLTAGTSVGGQTGGGGNPGGGRH